MPAKATGLEPEAQEAEVYRKTPFEFEVTAQPSQLQTTCTEAIPWAKPWVKKQGVVKRTPALPQWMRPSIQVR